MTHATYRRQHAYNKYTHTPHVPTQKDTQMGRLIYKLSLSRVNNACHLLAPATVATSVCLYVCGRAFLCVFVYVSARRNVCVCMCVCVYHHTRPTYAHQHRRMIHFSHKWVVYIYTSCPCHVWITHITYCCQHAHTQTTHIHTQKRHTNRFSETRVIYVTCEVRISPMGASMHTLSTHTPHVPTQKRKTNVSIDIQVLHVTCEQRILPIGASMHAINTHTLLKYTRKKTREWVL